MVNTKRTYPKERSFARNYFIIIFIIIIIILMFQFKSQFKKS